MSSPEIVLHDDAEENGLASMIADLMRENLADSPYKTKVFSLMKGIVTLEATDAEVRTTLSFDRGRCVINDGVPRMPDLWVVTDSESILELSLIRIVKGLPYYFDETGKALVKKMISREVHVEGAALHPILLTQLTIALSVN